MQTDIIPEISVIVPIYNGEKFLHRCVDSILAQTFTNFELLLIDDGSTDGSAMICDEYAKGSERIRTYHDENRGVTYARKTGVTHALGKYLCFVDADDYILPYYLSTLYNAISDGEGDISYAASGNGVSSGTDFVKYLLYNVCDWGLPYKLYKRSLFDNGVLDISREINVGEDLICNIRLCLKASKVIFVKCDGYVYYMNPDSVTHTRKLSLPYEEMFMVEVEKSIGEQVSFFLDALWTFKMRLWKNLIQHNVRVSRQKEWVQWVLNNSKGKTLTLGDRILLYIHSHSMVYVLLNTLGIIKRKR